MRNMAPLVVLLAVGVFGAGCSDARPADEAAFRTAPISTPTAPSGAGGSDSGESRGTIPEPTSTPDRETSMRITITIGDQHLQATLLESAASQDLLDQLPLSIEMSDHGGVEKTGPLPSSLSLEGQPDGADPDVGDLGYFAPGNDLVLYYGDQSFYPGIVVLGRLDGDAAQRIADMDGTITATFEANGI